MLCANDSLTPQQAGMLRANLASFRHRHRLNVRLFGVQPGVVLMIILGQIEFAERFERRNDRSWKGVLLVKSANLGLSDSLFVLVSVENGRAILRADVVALAVELCRVVRIEEH